MGHNLQNSGTDLWSGRGIPFSLTLVLLAVMVCACASGPTEVYRGYFGTDIPEASLVTVELDRAQWAKFDNLFVDGQRYGAVRLAPGHYQVAYAKLFGFSFLVEPSMVRSRGTSGEVTFEPGRTYWLRADRTYGPGYRTYFWIEDAAGNIVLGTRKP